MTQITEIAHKAVVTPAIPHTTRQSRQRSLWSLLALAWRALVNFANAYSRACQRVRAYNDLTLMDHSTLQAISRNHELLDCVLNGQRPVGHQNRPEGRV